MCACACVCVSVCACMRACVRACVYISNANAYDHIRIRMFNGCIRCGCGQKMKVCLCYVDCSRAVGLFTCRPITHNITYILA